MGSEQDLSREGRHALGEARAALEQKWQEFGGQDGTSVTVEDVRDLALAHKRVTQLQGGFSETVRAGIFDSMRGSPLLAMAPALIGSNHPAAQTDTIEWLRREHTRWELLKAFANNRDEVPELARKMTACTTAIQLLTAQPA